MSEVLWVVLGIALGGSVAWVLALKRGAGEVRKQVSSIAEGLRGGNLPEPSRASKNDLPELKELREVLGESWVRRGRGDDDDLHRMLQRLSLYLRHRVESPLLEGLDGTVSDLRERADQALGAVEDLEFFLEDPPGSQEPEIRNLAEVVQEVTRDFASQSDVMVKISGPQEPIRIRVEPEPLKDAVFLILHNAGEFGGGGPVQVVLGSRAGKAHIWVRDDGPGFSAEALLKAMDPFYSTSPMGLGLGLPHSRRVVNGQGGEVFLRNRENGGAEVEIRLPLAD